MVIGLNKEVEHRAAGFTLERMEVCVVGFGLGSSSSSLTMVVHELWMCAVALS